MLQRKVHRLGGLPSGPVRLNGAPGLLASMPLVPVPPSTAARLRPASLHPAGLSLSRRRRGPNRSSSN